MRRLSLNWPERSALFLSGYFLYHAVGALILGWLLALGAAFLTLLRRWADRISETMVRQFGRSDLNENTSTQILT